MYYWQIQEIPRNVVLGYTGNIMKVILADPGNSMECIVLGYTGNIMKCKGCEEKPGITSRAINTAIKKIMTCYNTNNDYDRQTCSLNAKDLF